MNLKQVNTLSDTQIEELWKFYQNEWWTKDRTLEQTRCMIQHTDIIVAYIDEDVDKLVGFCRMLTDFIFKAVILDVIVHSDYRGKGIGAMVMNAAVNHPLIQQVQTVDLWCLEEMLPFYRRWQFTEELGKVRLMRRSHRSGEELILE